MREIDVVVFTVIVVINKNITMRRADIIRNIFLGTLEHFLGRENILLVVNLIEVEATINKKKFTTH